MRSLNNQHLDIRALNAFSRLAISGNFGKTARQLGVTTSALSQTIRQLEEDLGQPLFDRTTRPAMLTRFGEQILPAVQRLLDDAHALQQKLHMAANDTPQNIRLGCIDSVASTIGPALIRGLSTQQNFLQLYSGLSPDIASQLSEHYIDFAISSDPMPDSSSIHCLELFQESWVAVFPKGKGPAQINTSESLRLASQAWDFVRYSQRSKIGIQIERYAVHQGIRSSRRFEFDASDTLLSLVAANMGWAITTVLCLLQSRHNIESVDVVELNGSARGHRSLYLLWRDDTAKEHADLLARIVRRIISFGIQPEIKRLFPHFEQSPLYLL